MGDSHTRSGNYHQRRAEYLSNYLAFLQMKARVGIEVDMVTSTRPWDVAFYAVPFRAGDRVVTARRACAVDERNLIPGARRSRWLVTASTTGRGGNPAPALLKWSTLATPGVSDLSNGTSMVICLLPLVDAMLGSS
jgi:hypothetical protein